MADTDDVQKYGRKLRSQLERLQTSDIDPADKQAIQRFVEHLEVNTGNNQGTIAANLNRLRLSAERGPCPLTEADRDDVTTLLGRLKREHDLAEGTRREYRKALRKFYRYRDADFWREITIGPSPDRSVDPDRLLDSDEIDAILDAAPNPRDKAAIGILADTGMRVGAICSLRVRDVSLDSQPATVSINEQGNVKGASGTVPLTWSRSHVSNWLDVHPRRDEPDAALIHKQAGYRADGDGALTYQYLSRRLREIGTEAGIAPDRLNTHNFRKTAITRWIREGLSEQAIKHRAFWVKDSQQFETYSGITDEEMVEQIAAHYDIDTDADAGRPSLDQCPQCDAPLRDAARYCPNCGAPLTQSAADEADAVQDEAFESASADDGQHGDLFAEFRRRFNEDPEFRARVVGDHADSS